MTTQAIAFGRLPHLLGDAAVWTTVFFIFPYYALGAHRQHGRKTKKRRKLLFVGIAGVLAQAVPFAAGVLKFGPPALFVLLGAGIGSYVTNFVWLVIDENV